MQQLQFYKLKKIKNIFKKPLLASAASNNNNNDNAHFQLS